MAKSQWESAKASKRQLIATRLLLIHVAFLLYITWFMLRIRDPHGMRLWNLTPLNNILPYFRKGGWEFTVNILGNLGVFMPCGFLLPIALGRSMSLGQIALASMGLSLVIEIGQWLTAARVADIDDVLLNTIGGCLGYALLRLVQLIRKSEPETETDSDSHSQAPRPGLEPGTPC